MPDPVRDALTGQSDLTPTEAALAAGHYLAAGEPQAAVSLLLRRTQFDDLAGLLGQRPWVELQALALPELRSILDLLPAHALERHPRLLLSVARVAEAAVELDWRAEVLRRAAASAQAAGDDELLREAMAEEAYGAAVDGDIERAVALEDEVLGAVLEGELVARARALSAKGRARAFERTPASMREAAHLLGGAAGLLRLAGERELLSSTLVVLGYAVHFAEGELEPAVQRLREAADAALPSPRNRATVLTFLADALLYVGRLDEAEAALREVGEIARRLRDQRLLGYHAWMRAAVASRRGQAEALSTWLEEAERHPGRLVRAPDWHRVPGRRGRSPRAGGGDAEGAAAYLARVEARCAADAHPDVEQIALFARAVHGARFGDPVAAQADLVAVLASKQLPHRDAWRMELLRGVAALRGEDLPAAGRHARRAH